MALRHFTSSLALATLLACSVAIPATSEAAKVVHIVRGGGGYFPNLPNIVNKNYKSRGLTVVDFRVDQQSKAIKEMAESYKNGKLQGGIHIVGYSAGGPATINIANKLGELGIPVNLIVMIETIKPSMPIPANVKNCFNLHNSLARPVRAVSPERTTIYNCNAHKDAGFGPEYGHFRIPWVDGVHEMIADEVLNAIAGNPPGKTVAARKAKNESRKNKKKKAEG
ncbi:MAG: hypothetical protein AAF191_04170 [Verrucomicrobiota bacterium]